MSLNIILIGPQASGKGTQALLLEHFFNLKHLSSGQILRNLKVEKKQMKAGELLSDDYINSLLFDYLKEIDFQNFILDGYPRTIGQVEFLNNILKQKIESRNLAFVFYLKLELEDILDRVKYRFYCPNCGAIYNTKFYPPKKEGICDYCGYKLLQRSDDQDKVVLKRYEVFEKYTKAVLEWYQQNNHYQYSELDARQSIQDVFIQVINKIYDQIKK